MCESWISQPGVCEFRAQPIHSLNSITRTAEMFSYM